MNKFEKLTFWFNIAWIIMMSGGAFFIVTNNYLFSIVCALVAVCIALMEKGIRTLND
ncbi:MAG: hypothetical protein NUV47_01170 [Patescibacteria group bacterium]|nr:hypothetical protein [Patescibacteria group bacterium]